MGREGEREREGGGWEERGREGRENEEEGMGKRRGLKSKYNV